MSIIPLTFSFSKKNHDNILLFFKKTIHDIIKIIMSTEPIPSRPNTIFVKASDIRNLFEITKREYNDILVRINKITLNTVILYNANLIYIFFKAELRFIILSLNINFEIPYKDQNITMISKVIK